MVLSITPKTADQVRYQLPDYIRTQNPTLIKFLEYYYEHMAGTNMPDDFLKNIVEYKDVDSGSNIFNEKTIRYLLSKVPLNTNIDKSLFVKKVADFFKSKGNDDSFKFIMNALFNEEGIRVDNKSKYVLRPSDNAYIRDSSILVQSAEAFANIEGAFITQYHPTTAYAVVETTTSISYGGSTYHKIMIKDKTVQGNFSTNGLVKVLPNTVNRQHIEIKEYYALEASSPVTITLRGAFGLSSYVNLYVKQIGSTYQAKITALLDRYSDINGDHYQFSISNVTGSLGADECYILAENEIDSHFTKDDYYYGTVASAVDDIQIENSGALYRPGQKIKFAAGSGQGAISEISGVLPGSVSEVQVINGGSGYSLDDTITTYNNSADPAEFKISALDGYGAEIDVKMAISHVTIINGGIGYSVGDTFSIVSSRYQSACQFNVTSIGVDGTVTGVSISQGGVFIDLPQQYGLTFDVDTVKYGLKIALTFNIVDAFVVNPGSQYKNCTLTVTNKPAGAVLVPIIKDGCVKTSSINISNGGSGYTWAKAFITSATGFNCKVTPVITGGIITNILVNDSGYGYAITDTITILGDGSAAAANLTVVYNGCVYSVLVMNGGANYAPNTTLSYASSNGGSLPCSLTPTINSDGSIGTVIVNDIGEGYSAHDPHFALLQETTSDNILTEDGFALDFISPYDDFVFGGYVDPIIAFGPVENGEVLSVEVARGGTGFKSTTEVEPIKIVITDSGQGAVAYPIIDNGSIVSIRMLDSGFGYTLGTTATVVGGGGTGAILAVTIVETKVSKIEVINGGSGYQYGTSVIGYAGNGFGAEFEAVVDTGISNIFVIDGGNYYSHSNILMEDGSNLLQEDYSDLRAQISTSITILDPTGTGAEAVVETNDDNQISAVRIINRGSGYTNPTYTLNPNYSSNPTIEADLSIIVRRNIEHVNVTKPGQDYSGLNLFVLGDGSTAKLIAHTETNGSLNSLTLINGGAGFITKPQFSIQDFSGYGAISKVDVSHGGSGLYELPMLEVTGGTSAKLIAMSETIGKINKVNMLSAGYGYSELPVVAFPINVLVKETANFILGETVNLKNFSYLTYDTSYSLQTEDVAPTNLLTESGDVLEQVIKIQSTTGFEGTISNIDYDRNLISIALGENSFGDYRFITESGDVFISELGMTFVKETSASIAPNDILYGTTSKAQATVLSVDRASGLAKSIGKHSTNFKFLNDNSKLNNEKIKLHNNFNIQDFAYSIVSGLSLDKYEKFIKSTVHPAGYKLLGDVEISLLPDGETVEIMLPDDVSKQIITIFFTTELGLLGSTFTEDFYYSNEWFDQNKFFMNAIANVKEYGTTEDSFNITTEDGEALMFGFYALSLGGPDNIDYYRDYVVGDVVSSPKFKWLIENNTEIRIN